MLQYVTWSSPPSNSSSSIAPYTAYPILPACHAMQFWDFHIFCCAHNVVSHSYVPPYAAPSVHFIGFPFTSCRFYMLIVLCCALAALVFVSFCFHVMHQSLPRRRRVVSLASPVISCRSGPLIVLCCALAVLFFIGFTFHVLQVWGTLSFSAAPSLCCLTAWSHQHPLSCHSGLGPSPPATGRANSA